MKNKDKHFAAAGANFTNIDYSVFPLQKGDYEDCTFVNCNFHNASLSGSSFAVCKFETCNLSMAKTTDTTFNGVKFIGCKLLGVRFDTCSKFLFSVGFQDCTLNFSTFYKMGLKKTVFKNSILQECDFTEADLSNAVFDNCDLLNTTFDGTNLEKVDFTTSRDFHIDPSKNKIKKAKFTLEGVSGLLHQYDIIIEGL